MMVIVLHFLDPEDTRPSNPIYADAQMNYWVASGNIMTACWKSCYASNINTDWPSTENMVLSCFRQKTNHKAKHSQGYVQVTTIEIGSGFWSFFPHSERKVDLMRVTNECSVYRKDGHSSALVQTLSLSHRIIEGYYCYLWFMRFSFHICKMVVVGSTMQVCGEH